MSSCPVLAVDATGAAASPRSPASPAAGGRRGRAVTGVPVTDAVPAPSPGGGTGSGPGKRYAVPDRGKRAVRVIAGRKRVPPAGAAVACGRNARGPWQKHLPGPAAADPGHQPVSRGRGRGRLSGRRR